jgi:hypothetical protein
MVWFSEVIIVSRQRRGRHIVGINYLIISLLRMNLPDLSSQQHDRSMESTIRQTVNCFDRWDSEAKTKKLSIWNMVQHNRFDQYQVTFVLRRICFQKAHESMEHSRLGPTCVCQTSVLNGVWKSATTPFHFANATKPCFLISYSSSLLQMSVLSRESSG